MHQEIGIGSPGRVRLNRSFGGAERCGWYLRTATKAEHGWRNGSARSHGSGDPGCYREVLDRAVDEMRAVGAELLFPLLVPMLADPELEVRCNICEAILRIDPARGIDLALPLLNDTESTVRWHTCGLLHDFGDERAIDSLVTRMKEDPDPQVARDGCLCPGRDQFRQGHSGAHRDPGR